MQLGMVGLGRMGQNMVVRMAKAGHEIVVLERDPKVVQETLDRVKKEANATAIGTSSPQELVPKLTPPRAVWLVIPAGINDRLIGQIAPLLQQGDILIGSDSFYIDDVRRSKELASLGIHYLDVGISGGVWGLTQGYCLMIGGPTEAVRYLDPVLKALAPGRDSAARTASSREQRSTAEEGYLHCGPSGAGHFAQMVHDGIEYSLSAAYAEGLNILKHANIGKSPLETSTQVLNPEHYQYDFDLPALTDLWRRSNLLSSWSLDLLAMALAEDPELRRADRVGEYGLADSDKCRRTLHAAIDEGVPCNMLSAALSSRFASRQEEKFAWKVLQAMRQQFSGH